MGASVLSECLAGVQQLLSKRFVALELPVSRSFGERTAFHFGLPMLFGVSEFLASSALSLG